MPFELYRSHSCQHFLLNVSEYRYEYRPKVCSKTSDGNELFSFPFCRTTNDAINDREQAHIFRNLNLDSSAEGTPA
jgi:hypothetical protein